MVQIEWRVGTKPVQEQHENGQDKKASDALAMCLCAIGVKKDERRSKTICSDICTEEINKLSGNHSKNRKEMESSINIRRRKRLRELDPLLCLIKPDIGVPHPMYLRPVDTAYKNHNARPCAGV